MSARVLILLTAALVGLAGCSSAFNLIGVTTTAPAASSETTGSIGAAPPPPDSTVVQPTAGNYSGPLGVAY